MDIECDKTNNRKFMRCLKTFLNSIRQQNNVAPYKTISKFKKQFNVSTAKDAYKIAEDLYETKEHKYAPFDSVEADMKHVLFLYAGKRVRVMYLLDRDEAGDRAVKKDMLYTIPSTWNEMSEWWDDKRMWDWRKDTDENVFEANGMQGDVYITERISLTGEIISQSYLDNETRNCIFAPIMTKCNEKIDMKKNVKRLTAIRNKIKKLEKQYPNGVSDEELEDVCKILNVVMHFTFPFTNTKRDYGLIRTKKTPPDLVMSYINTRLNHVEAIDHNYKNIVMGKFYDDNELSCEILTNDIFMKTFEKFKNKGDDYVIYQRKDDYITLFKTLHFTYKREQQEKYNIIDEFNEKYGMKKYELCDVIDNDLSTFIRNSAHMTSFKINPTHSEKLESYINIYEEIDAIKAYAKFILCAYYEGFVGKITDFRVTDKIEGIGVYLIGDINWDNADKKLCEIQTRFKVYSGRNIYTSPELKFLMKYGVEFPIIGGAWGVRMDFEFPENMLEKDEGGISHYARWTGIAIKANEPIQYHMQSTAEYADIVKAYADIDVDYADGEITFSTPRKTHKHKAHIASFIFTYQRLTVLEQLMSMDLDNVIRVNVDGIKYIPHDFTYDNKVFKSQDTEKLRTKTRGLTMNGREDGFITMVNSCEKNIWARFHFMFKLLSKPRTHYDTELISGAGGTGKTHGVITDTSFVRPLFLFPTHKLKQSKLDEHKIKADVYHNLVEDLTALDVPENERDETISRRMKKLEKFVNNYNVIIIDEASMLTENMREIIFTRFKSCKIIFVGDIGYQIGPTKGNPIDITAFMHITLLTELIRCKCEKLKNVLIKMRDAIDTRKYNAESLIYGIQTITTNELKNKYKVEDMILNYSNNEKDKYTEMFPHLEKYYVTKCSQDHEYNTGDIYYEKPNCKHYEMRHGYTTHSIQGETFKHNIFINRDVLNNLNVLYTAVSRAEYLNQVYIITDN